MTVLKPKSLHASSTPLDNSEKKDLKCRESKGQSLMLIVNADAKMLGV